MRRMRFAFTFATLASAAALAIVAACDAGGIPEESPDRASQNLPVATSQPPEPSIQPSGTTAPTTSVQPADTVATVRLAGYELIPHGHPEAERVEERIREAPRPADAPTPLYSGDDLSAAAAIDPAITVPSVIGSFESAAEVRAVVVEVGEFSVDGIFRRAGADESTSWIWFTQQTVSGSPFGVIMSERLLAQVKAGEILGQEVAILEPRPSNPNDSRWIRWVVSGIETYVEDKGLGISALTEIASTIIERQHRLAGS